MAQWVTRLLCKHEDLKLIPDNQIEEDDTAAHAGSSSAGSED